MAGKWCLAGYDMLEGTPYPLNGEWNNESETLDAARLHMAHLEMTQPTAETGGQDDDGIQDQVWVIRPNRTRYRFVEIMIAD